MDELDLIKCYPLNDVVTCVLDKSKINIYHSVTNDVDICNNQVDTLNDSNHCSILTSKLHFFSIMVN